MTLKAHVIFEHYSEYFELTGKNFKTANEERHEGVHHWLKVFKIRNNLRMTKKTWISYVYAEKP